MAKSENSATGGDSAESLAEDLLKRFSDSQPDIKKEPAPGEYFIQVINEKVIFKNITTSGRMFGYFYI